MSPRGRARQSRSAGVSPLNSSMLNRAGAATACANEPQLGPRAPPRLATVPPGQADMLLIVAPVAPAYLAAAACAPQDFVLALPLWRLPPRRGTAAPRRRPPELSGAI